MPTEFVTMSEVQRLRDLNVELLAALKQIALVTYEPHTPSEKVARIQKIARAAIGDER